MELLIPGVALWCGVHLVPTLGKGLKAALVERIGTNPYRGLFTFAIVVSLALIIVGWNNVDPVIAYEPPEWGIHANNALMLLSMFLFVAAHLPTVARRVLRHPMLTGTAVWGIAHLLANGDQRSLTVFGALTVWSIAEVLLINAREGEWVKADAPGFTSEIIVLSVTAAAVAVVAFLHNLAGVPPFPFM